MVLFSVLSGGKKRVLVLGQTISTTSKYLEIHCKVRYTLCFAAGAVSSNVDLWSMRKTFFFLKIRIHRMSSLHLKKRRHTNKQKHIEQNEKQKKKKLINLLKTLCVCIYIYIYILILGKEKRSEKKHLPKFY